MAIIGNKNIKELKGTVLSDKTDKTITVVVESVRLHPLYRKRYKVQKKYYAHDSKNEAKQGDLVKIRQCRPMSRLKRRSLVEIIQKTEG